MTAKTTAERQRALREARAAAGLQEVRGIYARPEDHAKIKAYADRLTGRKARTTGGKGGIRTHVTA